MEGHRKFTGTTSWDFQGFMWNQLGFPGSSSRCFVIPRIVLPRSICDLTSCHERGGGYKMIHAMSWRVPCFRHAHYFALTCTNYSLMMLDMQSILQHSDFTEFKICFCKYIKTCHGTPMAFIFLHPFEDPFCPLPLLKWSGIKMQSPTARLFFNCISCHYLRQCSTTTAVYDLSPSKKKLNTIQTNMSRQKE